MRNLIILLGSIVASLILSPQALAAIAFIDNPLDASATSDEGGPFSIDSASTGILMQRSTFSPTYDDRGILEFPLSSIPAGSTIQSATLTIDVNLYSTSGPNVPVIQFHGYAGNGVLEVADATVPTNLVGSQQTDSFGLHNIAIDASYIQSLLGSASHLGLMAYQGTNTLQTRFYATEWVIQNPTSGRQAASLTIEYVPEPSGFLIACGIAGFLLRRRPARCGSNR